MRIRTYDWRTGVPVAASGDCAFRSAAWGCSRTPLSRARHTPSALAGLHGLAGLPRLAIARPQLVSLGPSPLSPSATDPALRTWQHPERAPA